MRTRSTTPLKSRSEPMGSWIGMAVRPKNFLHAFERAVEAGPLAVQLVDHDRAGQLEFFAKLHTFSVCTSTPATPSTSTSAASAATSAALRVVDEDVEAGRVDQVDFLLLPLAAATAWRW
jgi:hypothetical protein